MAQPAITSERVVASRIASLAQAAWYQCSENPPQVDIDFDALKLNTTSVMIGRYSTTKASKAMGVKPGSEVMENRLICRPRARWPGQSPASPA